MTKNISSKTGHKSGNSRTEKKMPHTSNATNHSQNETTTTANNASVQKASIDLTKVSVNVDFLKIFKFNILYSLFSIKHSSHLNNEDWLV